MKESVITIKDKDLKPLPELTKVIKPLQQGNFYENLKEKAFSNEAINIIDGVFMKKNKKYNKEIASRARAKAKRKVNLDHDVCNDDKPAIKPKRQTKMRDWFGRGSDIVRPSDVEKEPESEAENDVESTQDDDEAAIKSDDNENKFESDAENVEDDINEIESKFESGDENDEYKNESDTDHESEELEYESNDEACE